MTEPAQTADERLTLRLQRIERFLARDGLQRLRSGWDRQNGMTLEQAIARIYGVPVAEVTADGVWLARASELGAWGLEGDWLDDKELVELPRKLRFAGFRVP